MPKFIHLRCHTQFSLAEGAIKIGELVDLALRYNMPAVAMTDSANLFGIIEFSKAAAGKGIQPIIGVEMMVEGSKLVLYAKNDEGFANILKLVSQSYLKSSSPHEASLDLVEIEKHAGGLLCLTGGADGELAKLIWAGEKNKAAEFAKRLNGIFPNHLYIELNRHGTPEELKSEEELIAIAYAQNIPLIATNNCMFATRDMFEAHDALLCIAAGKVIADENRKKLNEEYYFKSEKEMVALFKDIPEALANTVIFAQRCSVKAEGRKPMLPKFPTDRTDEEELRFQAAEGLKLRLEKLPALAAPHEEYIARLNFELDVICKMQFPGYFLIVSDFIKWTKENGIPVGPGRGSGAGSLVAWSLLITDVDPIRFGLLFERFLNPERVSMPDFDIDFCQERREEVINYVSQKYGSDRVSQIITFGKLQARAVIRDVGRVLQIPYGEVDRISKMIPFNPVEPVTLSKALELDPEMRRLQREDETMGKLIDIALRLEGLNRHASTHAAGILIADRPLDELIPLYKDARSEIPVSQYSMKDAETAGLVKFDFLGLRTLTLVDKAVQLVRAKGIELDISTIPLDDAPVFEMLSKGDTIGVFQLDSTLVKDAIRKMRPDKFEDIVALTSLCRPGPMENIPSYNARKHGKEEIEYPHIKLEDTLKETYGIMVYQEQVMQAAQVLAGYSLGKADLLRRAMGKKDAKEMASQRIMFAEGCAEQGIEKKLAGEIFDIIAKFAGYGFNKSHAVAYALIAYQTAYLAYHHPVEFLTACMNMDSGDTDKLSFYKHEANRRGIKILPPDVNFSEAHFVPEGENIRYALGAIKGVGADAIKLVAAERVNGKFVDLFDFVARCKPKVINKKQMESLAKSGAFDGIHKNRAQIFESVEMLIRYNAASQDVDDSTQINLFDEVSSAAQKPTLSHVNDWDDFARLEAEYGALGFYLSDHPLSEFEAVLKNIGVIPANLIEEKVNSSSMKIKLAGVVATKKIRSGKRGRFGFAKLSDAFGVYEVVLYDDDLITKTSDLLDSNEPLLIHAEAKKDEGGVRLIAEQIQSLRSYVEKNQRQLVKIQDLEFKINKIENVAKLHEILIKNKYEQGELNKNKVSLRLMNDGKEILMALPDQYAIDPSLREQIASLG